MRVHLYAALGCALAAAACAGARTQSPRAPGAIVGTLRDSATGRPLERGSACVWLTASPHAPSMRCVPADSVTGVFRLAGLQPGEYTLRLQCVSLTLPGSVLDHVSVEITRAEPIRREFSVSTATCDKRPRRVITGAFRGHYRVGFEESRFTPCPADRWGIPSDSVGTGRAPHSAAWVRWRTPGRRPAWPAAERGPQGTRRYYVRFSGTVAGPGRYGHFGISPFLMTVDSILEARTPAPNDCG